MSLEALARVLALLKTVLVLLYFSSEEVGVGVRVADSVTPVVVLVVLMVVLLLTKMGLLPAKMVVAQVRLVAMGGLVRSGRVNPAEMEKTEITLYRKAHL